MNSPSHTPKHRPVLLVGSFPYKSVRQVFDIAGPALVGYAKRLPDGEAQGWIAFPAESLPRAIGLEESEVKVRKQPELPEYTLLRMKDRDDPSSLKFAPVGYDKIAIASYEEFKAARAAGKIEAGTKFQVSLPTPFGVIGAYVVAEDVEVVLPRFEEKYFEELDNIVMAIPASDLAIQWDIAVEIVAALLGQYPALRDRLSIHYLSEAIARACDRVPDNVELGLHFCYGNPGGRHIVEPEDTGLMVNFFNTIEPLVKRKISWVHMPVPKNRDDDAYFKPLAQMKLNAPTEFYLGLVHLVDGIDGAKRRIAAAKKFSPYFGVGWECGLRLFPEDTVPRMLELHKQVANLD